MICTICNILKFVFFIILKLMQLINIFGSWLYFLFLVQFGMLIEYLFEKFPNSEDANETAIGELQVSENFYFLFLN